MKVRYILVNIFFVTLFVQLINLLEIARIIDKNDDNIFDILFLSFLKIPTTIIDIIPFVIVISTAFIYRNLITNNEFISMRNIGYSILDIFKPIGLAIFTIGILIIIVVNPLSSKFEKIFENKTSKDFSNMYSIKIKNNELWIKNKKEKNEKFFFNISNIDLQNMDAKKIKIIYISDDKNLFYFADNGKILNKKFELDNVIIFDIDEDQYKKIDNLNLELNFNKNNLINSISNYKFVPFYNYIEHIRTLKKFNLYSTEVSLHYLSEILKPIFLIVIGFTVMGFSGKFRRNENFFKILFFAILIGFLLFLLKEVVTALTISFNISFWLAYFIILFIPLIIGLYQSINIEKN